jgi:hypothetical protein
MIFNYQKFYNTIFDVLIINSTKMKLLSKLAFVFILSSILFACKSESKVETTPEASEQVVDKSGKEYTSEYICPMHCAGSGSDTTGICPVCGMDYVLNEEKDHSGHDHSHEGHSH